ncbi:uncharacterized protein BDW47DRAFT_122453 [Aspergillus candidus]|uniref:Uncharacterized protein n=1 Tax=Aspergillus candidus TaxID=41067 RepID=A0A2I2FN25_ASPCN|nr:hypothetical protein BDW47DRAFT_122453 [Aspergillus candidus]PLB42021.1 hypothetical protein BDW47DRAFT_122453 [Aspergillus candidus]
MDLSSLEGPPIPITRLSESPSPPISPFNDADLAAQHIPRIQLDLNLPADITWDLSPVPIPNKHTYHPPPTQQQSTPSWSGVETLWETTYSRPSSRNTLHNDHDDLSHRPPQRTLSPSGAGSSRPSHGHSRSESSAHQQLVWLDSENIWVFVNSAPASPVSRPCWASHPTLAHSRSMESTTSSASSSTPAHMNAVDRTPRLRDSAVLDVADMSLPAAMLLPPPPPPYERHIYDRPLPPLPHEAGGTGGGGFCGGGGGREGRRGSSRWAAVARRINRVE